MASSLGREASAGQIYAIDGDLGAGKTVFCQGFAEGLGVSEIVNSPTFTIIQEYRTGRMPLYHFDVYRIGDPEELEETGYEEYFYGDGVCLIEWASLVDELIPDCAVRVKIEKDKEQSDVRNISISGLSLEQR